VHKLGPREDGHSAGDLGADADEVVCQQFVELVTDYFEGAMAPRTLSQVEEHLVICEACRNYLEQMRATVASLHALKPPAPAEPSASLLAALRARKAAE